MKETKVRRSVSLSKAVKGDILHSFFRDVSKKAHEAINKIEQAAALDIYDIIYGSMKKEITTLADSMLSMHDDIPLSIVTVKAKKKARRKGVIEPTINESFQFRNFSRGMSMDRLCIMRSVYDLSLPEKMAQFSSENCSRSSYNHIEGLVKRGLISKAAAIEIEIRYVLACKDAEKVSAPIIEIVQGVIEILQVVKSTKGLFEAWPECDKFLDLPEASSGALMKVDIDGLNEALDGLYPPAEKTSGA